MIVLMQNQVYSRYVYQMLMLYGRVAVPSLGTLTLHPVTASFNNDRSKLYPPATQISFDSQVIDQVLLVHQLTDAGMKADDATLLQSMLVADYKASFSQNQNFELSGLGTFYPDGFVEQTDGVFNRYQGLEGIDVAALPTYLKRNSDFVKVADAPILQALPKTTLSPKYIWPILLALLTMIVIIGWFLSGDGNVAYSDVVEEGKKTEISHTTVLNDDSLLTEIDAILEKSEVTPNIKDTSTVIVEKTDAPAEIDSKGKINQPIPSLKTCIVIVGAFKNENNANKLIKRINSKGYKTYTQMHNGLKRVGISYDCVAKNPDLFKSNIQKQFNKDAWHLHDTI